MIFILFLIFSLTSFISGKKKYGNVKKSVVSGSFYPENKNELSDLIDNFFLDIQYVDYEFNEASIRAVISPHAGYVYSGKISATGFNLLEDIYKTVIIIAPSHSHYFNGASILDVDYFETPLGKIKVSEKIYELLNENIFKIVEKAYSKEHSLEVQLPFLEKKLTNFKIIPIVYGNINSEKLANGIEDLIDNKTLIVISSDLSHYYDYKSAGIKDDECIDSILNLDIERLSVCEACGLSGIITLVILAKKFGWIPILIKKGNSGDVTDQKDRVVGYASIVFYDPKLNNQNQKDLSGDKLNESEKKDLLILARKTLENYFKNKKINSEKIIKKTKKLYAPGKCFVTLNKNFQLRGCIGNFVEKKLYEAVIENVKSAAFNDSRFPSLVESELDDIEIEISVLSESKKLEFEDSDDLINKLRKNIDGVIVKSKDGFNSATYLPQVWSQFKIAEDLMDSLCEKAGINKKNWRDPVKVDIFIYQADVFSESELL
jgi:AmmeMemoRadiSam system protein B/AmmeMemoRadiSam system protein A